MLLRLGLLVVALLLLPSLPTLSAQSPAQQSFDLGQKALQNDRFQEAIGHFQKALQMEPARVEFHLHLAASYLALGQDRQAVPHLAAYLKARPDHFLVRLPFIETLLRLELLEPARVQLERFVADVQNHPSLADEHLVSCHTRLMEIAEKQDDEYAERLHRGIGLYWLGRKRQQLGGAEAGRVSEEMLCKAAAELTLARLCRPGEARPCWYLHEIWVQLGQRHAALKCLRAAEKAADFSYLTPAEYRQLHLTGRIRELESLRR
jgi:tetratricopeptide (TPR) repeat protein